MTDISETDDIIPTAAIRILDKTNRLINCRAIIDTGSTKNFITEELAELLRLPRKRHQIPIGALNELTTISTYSVSSTISSRCNDYQKSLEFLAVPTITALVPEQYIDRSNLPIPTNLQLADPEFHKPAPVQLLIGAGTSMAALCIGQIKLSKESQPDLILQKTRWGWIVAGSCPNQPEQKPLSSRCHLVNIQNDLSKFWEIEEDSTDCSLTIEEEACEEHFKRHIKRDISGRYIVTLPFNDKQSQLGGSYHMALKRLQSLQKRFQFNPNIKLQYSNVIQDYIKLGYMTKIENPHAGGLFLPHQAVIKESSLTTKVRVVFDASAPSTTGLSLNDTLLAGPTIQDNIFSLLLRFRLHKYVLTGDIEKMYLQILVAEDDQKYLNILWREENESISTYQFNRLVFGLKPASYLATRCLKQLALDEQTNYPRASMILQNDLYVDDLLTGADTVEEVVQLREELTNLLNSGGFSLRQCASNTTRVIDTMPDHIINLQLQKGEDTTLKTLGVHWNSKKDAIIYTVKPSNETKVTKRIIFSEVAKIFDPLGLLNPVVVVAKLLIQELWRSKTHWDESLTGEVYTRWNTFKTQLSILNDISFNRNILVKSIERTVEVHGFCDASDKAYGACIYIKSMDQYGNVRVSLYCAKSRVAPIRKIQTTPRLELCAAVLLAHLYENMKSSINLEINRTVFWSDSMVALYWIRTKPELLKSFVSRRVTDIHSKTNYNDWRHVRTYDNPADLLSRGVLPADFIKSTLWKEGPTWLVQHESNWPLQQWDHPAEIPEIRKPKCFLTNQIDTSILYRYSSFTKLERVVAYCLRFLPSSKQTQKWLSVEELQKASARILYIVQQIEFKNEYMQIKKGDYDSLNKNQSRLLNLSPFLDSEGLIRVGGRLHNTKYPYSKKHPIVLPKAHFITKLIIQREHIRNLHSGIQATLYAVRQKYWPLDGRNQVRQVIRSCVTCARAKPSPVNYPMGQLPETRTIQTRPFTNTGIDYCGPFFIKEKPHRNRGKIKVYVSIFICLSTKAVHLEVVSDLTTEAFISALKRFISRRGRCAAIYSDNGSNFVGANNELKEIQALLTSEKHGEKVHHYLADNEIKWHFNPPASPHFGGIWEAAVKSFKHHLKRVVGDALFTFEQFNTLAIEIEAILNSRPLSPMSSDPHDFNVLTPAHFLIGDCLSSLPEADLTGLVSNRLSCWQHIQKVKQDFWKRWHKEYINELNIRGKWFSGNHSIKPGSIVTIRDDNLPPMQWRFGRVIDSYPGKDGKIRVVRLKTSTGETTRSVKKLVLLPVDSDLSANPKDST